MKSFCSTVVLHPAIAVGTDKVVDHAVAAQRDVALDVVDEKPRSLPATTLSSITESCTGAA